MGKMSELMIDIMNPPMTLAEITEVIEDSRRKKRLQEISDRTGLNVEIFLQQTTQLFTKQEAKSCQ